MMADGAASHLLIIGCGYVGTALALRARAAGWAVTGVVRSAASAEALQAQGIRALALDLAEPGAVESLPRAVEHLVVSVGAGRGGLDAYRRSYLGVQDALRGWIVQKSLALKTYSYTGSTGVYSQRDGSWVSEAQAGPAERPQTQVLLEAEQRALAMPADRARVFRLAGIYGPGRHHLLDQLRRGERDFAGPGDFYLNLIHRDDAAGALWHALSTATAAAGGLYNLADGSPATKAEVVTWLAQQLGQPPPRFHPELQDARSRRRGVGQERPHRRIDTTKIREILQWTPAYADFKAGYRPLLQAGMRRR